jgi:hypothetical protein
MSNENIEAHLQTSQHMKKLGEIVESTIDTQLSLSKRLARAENELRLTQKIGTLIIGGIILCVFLLQIQI